MDLEKEIVVYLNSFRNKRLDKISEIISDVKILFVFWTLLAIALVIIDFQFGIILALQLALVFIIHCILGEGILKYGVKLFSLERKRPYIAYPNEIKRIGVNFSDTTSSFPSGHMASITGGLIVLYAAFPSALPIFIVVAIVIALSRMHNGLHYPSDILGGIALGYFYAYVAFSLAPKILPYISVINY